MSSLAVNQLLHSNAVWQASQKSSSSQALSTGYIELDQQLHYAGWPQAKLTEILLSQHGIGELRLLTPLLRQLNQQAGYITWVNPPYLPYPAALLNHQLLLEKTLVIKTKTILDSIWAAQQAMASQSCSAVLLWLPDKHLTNEIRKLNLAAKAGHCWGVIFRSLNLQQQTSAAALRITMQVQQQRQQLSIIKQPGGWAGQKVTLNLFPERQNWTNITANQWPTFQPHQVADNKQTPPLKREFKPLSRPQSPSYH